MRAVSEAPDEAPPPYITEDAVMDDIRSSFARQGLYRTRDGRVLGGVCAGIGQRVGLRPWPARLVFVLVLLLVPGSQLLVYPVLWLLMPEEGYAPLPRSHGHGSPA